MAVRILEYFAAGRRVWGFLGIEAHDERVKETYASNPDVDTTKSHLNFHLIEPPGKYRAAFKDLAAENRELTAENAQLAEKSKESAVHRLAEIKLQRDYAEAVAVLERIPPEITAQYGHRKPETAHDR